jgi:hypothetical protein
MKMRIAGDPVEAVFNSSNQNIWSRKRNSPEKSVKTTNCDNHPDFF